MHHNMRTFYTLILTQTLSLIGSRISGLAVGIWIFADTGNATPLTLVAFFSVLPQVLASTLSGVLADRWDRRYVMVLADAGQAAGTLLLLLSIASGQFELWHLYVITVIQAVFSVFQGPAFQASVTLLVPDAQRDRANAIQQMSSPAAGIIAPVLAGGVYAVVGLSGAIIIDLLTFVVAMIVIYTVHIPRPEATAEGLAARGSAWQEALAGLTYLRRRRTLLFLVLYIAMVNFLVGGSAALSTPYILARTDSEPLLGLVLGIMNLGALLGAIFMGIWGGTRPRIHTMMPGLMITCVFMMLAGMAQSWGLLAVFMFGILFPIPIINAAFMSMMQAKVAPDLQGRVFAVLGQLSMLLTPLAYLIVGPLADTVFEPAVQQPGWSAVAPLVGSGTGSGMGLILLLGGLFTLVLTVGVYALPAIRRLEIDLPDYTPAAAPDTQLALDDSVSAAVAG